jgi:acyl dehydratase
MSDPLEARIGEILQWVELPVEAGKIREFSRAIDDVSPVRSDKAAARAAGFTAQLAPPTFTTTSFFHVDDYAHIPRSLGLDLARLVHGEQSWDYHRPVVAGDVLTGVSILASVTARPMRSGGAMRRIVISTTFVDEAGEPVISEAMTMIELPAAG